jgi:diguanylate cyclase (GGDEF)-like protein
MNFDDPVIPAPPTAGPSPEAALRRLEKRDWWLWSVASVFLLSLTAAIHSFTLRGVANPSDSWREQQQNAAYYIVLLVLLFIVFALHRQWLFNRLRRQLSAQSNLMSALETRAEVFHKLSILDPLTGLYNRRFALQHLPTEMARAERHNYILTVLMFDLNGLKQINDRYGHSAGDLALREFAIALRKAVRSSDIAARMSGDEFVAILPECTAQGWPQILGRMTGLTVDYRGERIPIRFATGWAEYVPGDSVENLLERADAQMYDDKRTGTAELKAVAAQEHLRQREKLTTMGRVTSGVAHDFNNLLTVIKGYTELALDRLGPRDEVRAQLEEVHKAAERAVTLTGQLLAFSRKQVFERRVLDFNKLLASSEMMLRRLLGDRITLQIMPAIALQNVFVDASQMEQMVMNLAANARDAMPAGGTLLMQTDNFEMDNDFCATHAGAHPGSYVRLTVTDTGALMGAEMHKRIFQPFLTETGRARGLGLSAVYGMVKQNGGYFWLEGEAKQGNMISIFLPSASEPEFERPEEEVMPEAPMAEVGAGAGTVLVVEGLDSLRQFMCDFLRLEGYDTLRATTANEAIHTAAEFPGDIDLVIADLILPGMSGIELVDCIRTRRPEVKVLYVTGYTEDILLYKEWLQSDAQFLTAPFTSTELSVKLQRLLAEELAPQV